MHRYVFKSIICKKIINNRIIESEKERSVKIDIKINYMSVLNKIIR